jgi:hypothetical protein
LVTARGRLSGGAAKILHFVVYDGRTRYELALNLSEFTWRLSGDEDEYINLIIDLIH